MKKDKIKITKGILVSQIRMKHKISSELVSDILDTVFQTWADALRAGNSLKARFVTSNELFDNKKAKLE